MKNMSSGIIFSDILRFVGYFLVSFCVSGPSFDVFGVLGTSWCQNQSNLAFHGSLFGSIPAPFFEENRVIFMLFFDCFSGCLFY